VVSEGGLASSLREKAVVQESLVRLRANEEGCRQRLSAQGENLQSLRERQAATVSRLTSLRELEEQFAGYDRGVKLLLTSQQFTGRFAGVLADLIETDTTYEKAMEAALGHRLQHLVPVGEEQQLLDAVNFLKGSEGGRCGFLVGGEDRSCGAISTYPCLLELLNAPPGFMQQIRPLLATTYLVPDIATALTSARLHPEATFVTAEGELVSPGGVLTVGAAESGGGLIHKRREIKQLEGLMSELAIQMTEVEEQLRSDQAELEHQGHQIGLMGQEIHRLDMQILTLEKDGARFRDECTRIQELISLRCLEDEQLKEERAALVAEVEQAGVVILELETSRGDAERGVEECQQNVHAQRANLELARERLTSLRVAAAALNEKHESIQAAVLRIDEHLVESARRESRHREDLVLWARQQQDTVSAITEGAAEVKAKMVCIADQDVAVQSLRQSVEEIAEQVRDQERLIRQQREEDIRLRQLLAEGGIRLAELKGRQNQLHEFLAERYRLTPEDAIAATETTSDQEESLARQQELKRLIDELGEVNLSALEEYRQLEERHGFLVSQKADLEDSLQELQRAIGTINRTTRKRFLETFTKVNERFKIVFPRLFCGGTAELRLTNEDDLLDTGIDIIVQPPGKKLQNVSLLSGGEKALTAVALIFSIFLIKPSPFCLLDEVDAPLDEANIGRFNEIVREMSRTSQFIMITHSKATMGMADTLYGVTMEEPGVSKVVSVRLNEGSGG
jgi:chromosome segregation protein